ncbi:hypothetical protein B0H15DRAFT_948415 [Mycena belliarum]|uniref:Nitrogen regulatory protein areA GATA-like domain-containing protein n=1 Tax=Mycena belliarum TaxID=1033014 RepID=A0AAD6U5C7_9AGAR|nr:hypothetical protein B0H15DRAFT_948415 [Mycena belliae]
MANYLPVLLASVTTNAVPDDSALVTLPRGQVDYLSHEWAEEDVWRSWRNMTRHKNEITNGARLENASWRTWWKQRNKLKTVTPETLNWLKDSDVTWLYGPLHTAVDWAPPPKPKPDPTEVGKLSSAEDRLDLASKHKPILKYRTISEQLTSDLGVSPVFSPPESEDEDDSMNSHINMPHPRLPLLQTKSTPRIYPRSHAALRKPSPPRVGPPCLSSSSTTVPQPKRRITFNTFVEQCISVDSPRRIPLSHNSSSSSSNSNSSGDSSKPNAATAAWDGRTRGIRWAAEDEESDEDDASLWQGESALSSDSDDALEVCLPRSRSNSSYSRSSHSSNGSTKPTLTFSTSKTIVPIAPARLKTTGVGNSWAGGGWVGTRDEGHEHEEVHLSRSAATVDLHAASQNLSSAFDADESFEEDVAEDEVFTHRSAYFSAGGAYDYFAGPDLGVEFAPGQGAVVREQRGRRGSTGAEILQIEGASPLRSRSKSRSKSRSRSRTPSPALLPTSSSPNTSVSPNASSPPPAGRASGLLSPPPRGRDSSLSSSSSASQTRGRSATRTSSSSSLSDRERSRSSHTSPMGSLSPEYGGVRVSADSGTGFPYGYGVSGYGVNGKRRKGSSSLSPSASPDDTSPEKSAESSTVSTVTSAEDSNSGSSGGTATRPRVEVNGIGAGRLEEETQRLNTQTPANSPVVRSREPMFISTVPRSSPGSAISSSTSGSGSGTPTLGSSAPPTPTPATLQKAPSPQKSPPPNNRTLPIPVARAGKAALTLEDAAVQVQDDNEETRRANPTPANSPIARMRPPPRIPGAGADVGANNKTKLSPSTAKSIPVSAPKSTKPMSPPKPPIPHAPASPALATFQTANAAAGTAERSAMGSSGGSASALQRTLVPGEGDVTIVGKAVGMVSTAGAYLGLWSGA